ncbi:zona pellucida sperm-binding protein 4-like [Callorhinchus milii]|uniref:zona pellucida sperm-binding protein 4-like n=1 Tax=Callorhinchus milii TaxID=7868 RepID=UPI001C3FAA64|nr:zona pellucida sperm-binding protein 4-like [Callorhinchus milii]
MGMPMPTVGGWYWSCCCCSLLLLAAVSWAQAPDLCSLELGERKPCGFPGIKATQCIQQGCCFHNSKRTCTSQEFAVCTKNGEFLIVITKDVTVPHLNLSSVHLKEGQGKECGAKKISTDVVIFQFPVTACGTQHRMKSGHLVYETDVLAARQILNEHEGSITRDSTFRLHVQCRYNGSQEADLRVNPIVYTHPPPLPATMEGPLHLQLRIAKGRGYQTWYVERDYPILRRLRDPVFVEVRVLNRNDPSLVLILHHCWATPTSEPRHQVQWDVLVHGCPYTGDNYKTLPISVDATSGLRFPSHHKRFVVKTFVFLARNSDKPLSGEVYLHCSAEVCSTSRGDACFTSCSPKKRRSADEGEGVLVSADGPIVFIQDGVKAAVMNPEEEGIGAVTASQVLPAVAAGFSLLSLAMITLAVALCRVKRPREVRYESGSSDL